MKDLLNPPDQLKNEPEGMWGQFLKHFFELLAKSAATHVDTGSMVDRYKAWKRNAQITDEAISHSPRDQDES